MWYPGKAAFRAGEAGPTAWDDANIGGHSVAMGGATTASGDFSTALGISTIASGDFSTALGSGTVASGDFTTAMGHCASTNSQTGAFVYGDGTQGCVGSALVTATAPNQFVVRASGGLRLFTSSDTRGFTFEGGFGTGCVLASSALTCSGTIASATGGFKFPDGTVQTTAGAGAVTDHGALTGLSDDDHAQYLLTDGVRSATNGFAVTGILRTGAIPATGDGVRLMWYPGKAAFRAGRDDVGRWNDANIGVGSVAMGLGPLASGTAATAIGAGAQATQDGAVALGWGTRALGANSVALGWGSAATGEGSTAIGWQAVAEADYSTAMGRCASTNFQRGAFVYADGDCAVYLNAPRPNSFTVRASGGFGFRTSADLSTGCDLPAGSSTWSCGAAKLQSSPVSAAPPATAGQVLTWDGAVWVPATPPSGGVTDHGTLLGLTDDDHRQYLLTDGVRAATNGFAVTGTIGHGAIPASGPGTRLMWYPGKAAFRAGSVDAGQWDDASVGQFSTAMGLLTTASGAVSTALGSHTIASGLDATALGSFTMASGDRSTAIGLGTVASGAASTAFGRSTTASGDRSTAMGTFASTNDLPGSFVYGDESTFGTGALVQATAANQFVVRAAGGTTLYSSADLTAGVSLAPGAGAWASVSDVNRKENFRELNGEDMLATIAGIPVREWNYKAQHASIRHLGPTAQDFHAAFGLGESDTTITTTDADGVALLAIQALEQRTRDLGALREHLAALEHENAQLRADLNALRDAIARQRKQP